MPEVGGVLELALFVDDPGQSGEFYRSIFGFETVSVSPRGVSCTGWRRPLISGVCDLPLGEV